jgi:hypothetical protein
VALVGPTRTFTSRRRGCAAEKRGCAVCGGEQEATAAERDAMAAMKDPELIPPMLANVRVTMPGLEKLKSASKNAKRAGKN